MTTSRSGRYSVLLGNSGDDTLHSNGDLSQLLGGSGATAWAADYEVNYFRDLKGGLFAGGRGADVITDGTLSDIVAGGEDDDHITLERGADVLLFNLGDGRDVVDFGRYEANPVKGECHDPLGPCGELGFTIEGEDDDTIRREATLSLGGGIRQEDITLARFGHDLEVRVSPRDSTG